jgi:hypothetical protein
MGYIPHTFVLGHKAVSTNAYRGTMSPGTNALICIGLCLASVQIGFSFRAITKSTFVPGQNKAWYKWAFHRFLF